MEFNALLKAFDRWHFVLICPKTSTFCHVCVFWVIWAFKWAEEETGTESACSASSHLHLLSKLFQNIVKPEQKSCLLMIPKTTFMTVVQHQRQASSTANFTHIHQSKLMWTWWQLSMLCKLMCALSSVKWALTFGRTWDTNSPPTSSICRLSCSLCSFIHIFTPLCMFLHHYFKFDPIIYVNLLISIIPVQLSCAVLHIFTVLLCHIFFLLCNSTKQVYFIIHILLE